MAVLNPVWKSHAGFDGLTIQTAHDEIHVFEGA